MKIDFHTHGKLAKKLPFSEEYTNWLFQEASKAGLDAICLTEHFNTWGFDEIYQYIANHFEQEQDLPEAEINILYQQWCDILKTDSAEILASYGDCYYAGQPAITRNHFGKGRAYYIGTVCNRALYIALAKCMAKEKGISYYDNLPLGVEITYRRKEKTVWRFIFNNTGKTQEIRIDDVQYLLNPFEMKMERLTQ